MKELIYLSIDFLTVLKKILTDFTTCLSNKTNKYCYCFPFRFQNEVLVKSKAGC